MAESVMGVISKGLKKSLGNNLFTNLGALLVKPAFSELKRSYDYEEYGGVPLLGVNGVSIICHVSSLPFFSSSPMLNKPTVKLASLNTSDTKILPIKAN